MSITDKQHELLSKPLASDYIKTRKGGGGKELSYVEGWYCIHRANEIFGFDGWTHEVVDLQLVSERFVEKSNDGGKYRQVVVLVRAKVRVTALGVAKEDIGICIGTASETNVADAHDLAWKGAITDAMKRTLRLFGNQFGNALYDKEREFVGASLDGQALLDDAKTLDDNIDTLKSWFSENQNAIEALPTGEKNAVFEVLTGKKTRAMVARFEHDIANAQSQAELAKLFHALPAANFDKRTHDRLVTLMSARKAQLGRAAA